MNFTLGDYDRNGAVEGGDYAVWSTDFGSPQGIPGAGADGNFDGVVNAADYTVWRDAQSAASASLPTPEPSAVTLSIATAASLTGVAGRRREAANAQGA